MHSIIVCIDYNI